MVVYLVITKPKILEMQIYSTYKNSTKQFHNYMSSENIEYKKT